MNFRALLPVPLALLLACAYTTTHRVMTGSPSAAHSGEVAVFMVGTPPPPYQEVAIVQAVGNGGHADLEHVVEGLKEEARRLGCTAIVNVKVDQGSGTASGTGICGRLLPTASSPPPTPPAAPPPVAVAPVASASPAAAPIDAGSEPPQAE